MNTTTTQQPVPDYGEPWDFDGENWITDVANKEVLNLDSIHSKNAKRLVACVNACTGMADPAAEIQAMRDELADIRQRLKGHPDSKLDGENGLAAATMRGFDGFQVENEAMRTVIKQAHATLEALHNAPWLTLPGRAGDEIENLLANLQAFLKP